MVLVASLGAGMVAGIVAFFGAQGPFLAMWAGLWVNSR